MIFYRVRLEETRKMIEGEEDREREKDEFKKWESFLDLSRYWYNEIIFFHILDEEVFYRKCNIYIGRDIQVYWTQLSEIIHFEYTNLDHLELILRQFHNR